MAFLLRHRISFVVVLAAFLATASVFVFARPEYRPRYESKMINLAEQDYISPSRVRAAFAAESLPLRYGVRYELTTLSNVPQAKWGQPGAVLVNVAGRVGSISFGPKLTAYDARFENVLVTYDGTDEVVLERIKAAVAALEE